MRVGILGSGDVARHLAGGFLERGDEVRLGSRSGAKPELAAWISDGHPSVRQGTFAEVAGWGELIVLSARGMANDQTVRDAGPERFDGKIVIDTTNPLVFREGAPPAIGLPRGESAGARLQKALPRARVVKAWNTIGALHMVHPQFPEPATMFLCGNDAAAKASVAQILASFGWRSIVDAGGIEASEHLEALCAFWIHLGVTLGDWGIGFRLERQRPPAAGGVK
ncbi:MAG: NAD(P)-binding domain-containing protein [Thermoplasmata archaeon]